MSHYLYADAYDMHIYIYIYDHKMSNRRQVCVCCRTIFHTTRAGMLKLYRQTNCKFPASVFHCFFAITQTDKKIPQSPYRYFVFQTNATAREASYLATAYH